NARLEHLQREYARNLPERLTAVAELLMMIRNLHPEAVEELVCAAHKIRGTAGAYGFAIVSESMGCIEDMLRSAPRLELSPSSPIWFKVEEYLLQSETAIPRPFI